MALAEPDDETAMGTQVLGPGKSPVLSILGPGLITGNTCTSMPRWSDGKR
jgi:hypothetical protein